MKYQTANQIVDPQKYFASVSLPFPAPVGTDRLVRISRPRLRPARSMATRAGNFSLRLTAKKVLYPCLAALVAGQAISYAVQFFAFLFFLLH